MIERRSHERIRCEFPAELQILFPEMTFQPTATPVVVEDISASGARVLCRSLTSEQLDMLRGTVRHARLIVMDGERRRRVYGRIVWTAHKAGGDGPPEVELAMAYDPRSPAELEDQQAILAIARDHPGGQA